MEKRLLELVGELTGMLDLDELAGGMLVALPRLLPSDFVSINDIGPDPERVISLIDPPQDEALYRRFGELAHQNPLMARYLRTLDGRAYRFSDVIGVADYHALDLYKQVYGPMGVEHQMAFTLPATPGRVLAVVLSRARSDYTDAERDLADHARPHLIQVWRNAIEYTALRDEVAARPAHGRRVDSLPLDALRDHGLTERESDVLALVVRGRSNRDAGAILGVSDRTVQKHLEHCYRKLDVPGRSAAAELVWRQVAEAESPVDRAPRRGLDSHIAAGGKSEGDLAVPDF